MDISQIRERFQFPQNMNRSNGKPETYGKHAANQAANEQAKKDTVEISEEGQQAALQIGCLGYSASFYQPTEQLRQLWAEDVNSDDFVEKLARGDYEGIEFRNGNLYARKADREFLMSILSEEQLIELGQLVKTEHDIYSYHTTDAEKSIFDALNGKMTDEEARQVALELAMMATNAYKVSYNFITGYEYEGADLETKAENREAARDLAKYIAENYFDDPEEAKNFMDNINKYIEYSELQDKGYAWYSGQTEPVKPHPDGFELWLKKNEYAESTYDARVKYSSDEFAKLSDKYAKEYNAAANKSANAFEIWLKENGYAKSLEDAQKKYSESEIEKLYQDSYKKEVKDFWDELRLMMCDISILSEDFKAWYAAFDANVNLVQSIIDNAKQITDFSSNERWNFVMNLLQKTA